MNLSGAMHADMGPIETSRDCGRNFEEIAESYLRERGLSTVARNYTCRVGEIDLIMLDGETVVFVEVRYRRSLRFGGGLESITDKKRNRLIRTAAHFLVKRSGPAEPPCRFDVLAITGGTQTYSIDWIADAFSA